MLNDMFLVFCLLDYRAIALLFRKLFIGWFWDPSTYS